MVSYYSHIFFQVSQLFALSRSFAILELLIPASISSDCESSGVERTEHFPLLPEANT